MPEKNDTLKLMPREKAISQGISVLSDEELLAIILKTGYKNKNVLELSRDLLEKTEGLAGLTSLDFLSLTNFKGISKAKALEIMAINELCLRMSYEKLQYRDILSNPKEVTDWLKHKIGLKQQEHFMVLFLNKKNYLIGYRMIYIGNSVSVDVNPKDIFKEALVAGATGIILVHNHPSQNVEPSKKDVSTTKRIISSGEMMGIPVLDHLIVSGYDYFSFKNMGLMK